MALAGRIIILLLLFVLDLAHKSQATAASNDDDVDAVDVGHNTAVVHAHSSFDQEPVSRGPDG